MSSSILEIMRSNYEQCDQLENMISEELDVKPNGQKPKVWQQHKIKGMVNQIVTLQQELLTLHTDPESAFQEEIKKIRENPIEHFYANLQSTMDYYQRFPHLESLPIPPIEIPINVDFTGEEVFGKYLDLNPLYLQYCNLFKHGSKEQQSQDYQQYLIKFNTFFYLSDDIKQMKGYYEYLLNLYQYLIDFYHRSNPLISLNQMIVDWEQEFKIKVEQGEIKLFGSNSLKGEPQPLRLGMFNDVKELEALGMDRLKEGLEALGLKCGGTLQDRASRLWSIRGKNIQDIPNNLKAKPSKQNENNQQKANSPYNVCLLEFKITSICEMMGDIVSATRRHVEKQQGLSLEEKQAEIMEEEFGLLPESEVKGEGEDDDDEGPIYNPLNLPLGWDGKPIPFWLYKLHGLGVEYKCEVCGNQSYWGRRAFDRHFQEWKHAYGMKCLGIPNTKHFHDITAIDDVVALYNKIKDQINKTKYEADFEEEYEDTHGNVLNRRTYEDLARQGLL